jgi:ssDNA-binding Zn-finger/Zn-ribbon topoisomerase 1
MKPQNVTCPECGELMVSRANKTTGQRFWGCSNYPACKGTRDTDGESAEDRGGSRPSRRWEGADHRWPR